MNIPILTPTSRRYQDANKLGESCSVLQTRYYLGRLFADVESEWRELYRACGALCYFWGYSRDDIRCFSGYTGAIFRGSETIKTSFRNWASLWGFDTAPVYVPMFGGYEFSVDNKRKQGFGWYADGSAVLILLVFCMYRLCPPSKSLLPKEEPLEIALFCDLYYLSCSDELRSVLDEMTSWLRGIMRKDVSYDLREFTKEGDVVDDVVDVTGKDLTSFTDSLNKMVKNMNEWDENDFWVEMTAMYNYAKSERMLKQCLDILNFKAQYEGMLKRDPVSPVINVFSDRAVSLLQGYGLVEIPNVVDEQ